MAEKTRYNFDSLLKSLSKVANSEPITVEADSEKKDLQDKATELAKSYWMIGWTWDEIDVTLQDMGYEEAVVGKAVNATQEHSYNMLKDGPFSTYKEGQLVKLTGSKEVTRLVARNTDSLVVEFNDQSHSRVKVYAEHIDASATAKLTKAFELRQEANALTLTADPKDIIPKETAAPEKFDFKMTPEMRAPKNWDKQLPEKFQDVPEAKEPVGGMVKAILSIRQKKQEAEKELTAAKELVKENQEIVKKIQREESETAKNLAGIIGVQADANELLEKVVFQRFQDLLIGFNRLVEVDKIPPNLVDKYAKLVDLLKDRVPELSSEILEAIDSWEDANSQLKETLVTELGIAKAPKKILSQNVWSKVKKIFSSLWQSVKDSTHTLKTHTLPEIEKISDELESFLSEAEAENEKGNVSGAMDTFATY
jgi:hypothetical protein